MARDRRDSGHARNAASAFGGRHEATGSKGWGTLQTGIRFGEDDEDAFEASVCRPAGRGHLTNAYGGSHTIAVTDNYGKFLTSAQLDFVIGHELGHAKAKHGRKKLLITAAVIAGIALASFVMSPFLFPFRPVFDGLVVFVPILTFYFLSRRFEYAADAAGVELTRDPETAIHALVNLHRITEAPMHCGKLTELFMTHPALTRRARAIGEKGGISPDRTREAIGENEVARHVR